MFKITNQELIAIAAVDLGLDPYAEYCTKGVYERNGYKIKPGELPVLMLELWCPRERKGESLSKQGNLPDFNSLSSETKSPGMFFQFKLCKLYTRSQVMDAEEIRLEKEAKRLQRQQEKDFKRLVKAMGGIKPGDYESLPRWAKNKNGMAIDVMAGELESAGYPVQDANSLFDMLLAI